MRPKLKPSERWVMGLGIAAGIVLLVIGIRFLVVPNQAARLFGLANPLRPFDLHHVVALRDLWLALMLIGLAALREWRALAMCLALGAGVCVGDAMIVLASSARPEAVGFHLVSGVYCGVLAWAAWRLGRRAG